MKIGIIGSGGREHAICVFLKSSSKVDKIYCFPGNAGTSLIAENINIDVSDFENIRIDFVKEFMKEAKHPPSVSADRVRSWDS